MGESAVVSRQPSCAFCGNRRLAQQTTEGAGFRGSKKMPAPQSAIRHRQWRVHTETLIAHLGAAPRGGRNGPAAVPIGWAPPGVVLVSATPAGLGIRLSPGRRPRTAPGIISARTPVAYARTKTTSCVPDTRLMASKIFASPTPSIAKSVRLGRTMRGDAGKKQLVMVRESAIEQRPTLWS